MLPAASFTAGHTPKKQKFLKALFTSLQGEEEIPVPLELLHELFVLQEERDPLVLQVLLPPPLLLQGALAPRDKPPWHGLPAAVGALGRQTRHRVGGGLRGSLQQHLGLSSAFCPSVTPQLPQPRWPPTAAPQRGPSLLCPTAQGTVLQKGQRGTGQHCLCPLGRGAGRRGWTSHGSNVWSSFCRAQAGTDY